MPNSLGPNLQPARLSLAVDFVEASNSSSLCSYHALDHVLSNGRGHKDALDQGLKHALDNALGHGFGHGLKGSWSWSLVKLYCKYSLLSNCITNTKDNGLS